MHCLPCGEKDVIANTLNQDKCPAVPLRLFLFKPARYIVWHVFLVALNFHLDVLTGRAVAVAVADALKVKEDEFKNKSYFAGQS